MVNRLAKRPNGCASGVALLLILRSTWAGDRLQGFVPIRLFRRSPLAGEREAFVRWTKEVPRTPGQGGDGKWWPSGEWPSRRTGTPWMAYPGLASEAGKHSAASPGWVLKRTAAVRQRWQGKRPLSHRMFARKRAPTDVMTSYKERAAAAVV